MSLYIIRDGAFTISDKKPASNLLHYDVFGKRYLDVFDSVNIVGRLFDREDKTALPVEGKGVNFIKLPGKSGLWGFIVSFFNIVKLAFATSTKGNSYILRIPGSIPNIYYVVLRLKKIPFSVEVCADPLDSYSKKSLDGHFLSSIIQRFFVWIVKKQCKEAQASVYVTEAALQRRYPPGQLENSFSFTSIDLHDFVDSPRAKDSFSLSDHKLALIGNMQGSMKGHDTLINAIKLLADEGIVVFLDIIGFGKNQFKFEQMCRELGIEKQVSFLGKLPSGRPILDKICEADLFVLPSRQEGLPRALLEAMSQALPAIGTRVGGTPELLPEYSIVEPDNQVELANKIKEFIFNPELLAQSSTANLNKAHQYSSDTIRKKRNCFLTRLNEISTKGM